MAAKQSIRWNRAETRNYQGPESMLFVTRSTRVTSKCGRFDLRCTSVEFRRWAIYVDGVRVEGAIVLDGLQIGCDAVTGIGNAKAVAAAL